MNNNITLIFSLLSLAMIWIFLFWIYVDYRVDSFRQRVFALRDDLFDEAANGRISFGKAYGLMRSTMNGGIRFAHQITLFHMLVIAVTYPRRQSDIKFDTLFSNMIEDLPENEINILKEYKYKFELLVTEHTLLSSPFLLITVIPVIVSWIVLRYCLKSVNKVLRYPLGEINAQAYAVGDDSSYKHDPMLPPAQPLIP
ncbi:MAG: hypothetical protein P8Y67_07600 [Alphaproteobacteria bacterium]